MSHDFQIFLFDKKIYFLEGENHFLHLSPNDKWNLKTAYRGKILLTLFLLISYIKD